MGRQTGCRRFTDFANPQRVKETGKGGLFGFSRALTTFCADFGPMRSSPVSLPVSQKIRRRMDVLFLNQLIDDLSPMPSTSRRDGRKMLERFFTLRAADQAAGTASPLRLPRVQRRNDIPGQWVGNDLRVSPAFKARRSPPEG
jgi:hypothetical protein